MEALSEELLTAWLRLTGAINNQRLVDGLSFNEAVVCGLLEREGRRGGFLTASELCAKTGILKSQAPPAMRRPTGGSWPWRGGWWTPWARSPSASSFPCSTKWWTHLPQSNRRSDSYGCPYRYRFLIRL